MSDLTYASLTEVPLPLLHPRFFAAVLLASVVDTCTFYFAEVLLGGMLSMFARGDVNITKGRNLMRRQRAIIAAKS